MSSQTAKLSLSPSSLFQDTVKPVLLESIRLFPDGLVLIGAFYALVTLSFPHAIFAVSMLESVGVYHILRTFSALLNIIKDPVPTPESKSAYCRSGFSVEDLTTLSLFSSSSQYPFPSAAVYILAAAASYCFSTLQTQAKELEALGPSYASRYYTSAGILSALLLIFMIYRIAYDCESPLIIFSSILFGLVVGGLLVLQNRTVFGKDSLNLIGIPLLRYKTADGKPIQLCTAIVR